MSEVGKAIDFLLDAAHFFQGNGQTKPKNIKASLQCLYTALSLVMPPSREAEIRTLLGEWLLRYTEDVSEAIDHLQKALRLISKISCDGLLRTCCETWLASALLRSGAQNLALPIIEDGLKRCEECEDWSGWCQIFPLHLQTSGPIVLKSFHAIRSRLPSDKVELLDTISSLILCGDLRHQENLEQLKCLELSLAGSPVAILKCICCLAIRLKLGHSEGFKTFLPAAKMAIENSKDLNLPTNTIDRDSVKQLAQYLLLLSQIRFGLSDVHVDSTLTGIGISNVQVISSLLQTEMSACKSAEIEESAKNICTTLQNAVWITSVGKDSSDALGPFLRAPISPDQMLKFRLWEIQILLVSDLDSAIRRYAQLKSDSTFKPSAYSFLVESLIGLKRDASLHTVKESLLHCLKILNGSAHRDDFLKLCVMLLLASIYQETDFAMAEKMSSTAHIYSRNLGNDRLALESGMILERMLDLQGKAKEAAQQQETNNRLRSRIV